MQGTTKRVLAVLVIVSCLVPVAAAGARPQRIDPPKIVKHVDPVYPEAARQARIQGVVTIEATIGADGKVKAAKVLQSIPLLDDAALAAVRQWEYAPTLVGGVAKPVIMTVKVNFALSQPPAAAPPVPSPPPATPDNVSQRAAQLALDGKYTEAIAMMEAVIARDPKLSDAQFFLGQLYEQRALSPAGVTAANRRDLESAVSHFARAAELQTDPSIRFVITWKLARMYGADSLNDPAEAERYAKKLVAEHPARAESHMIYAQMLRERGDIAGAADVMRKGRAVAKMPVPGLLMAAQYPMEQVQAGRALPRDSQRALLQESLAAVDAILARPEKDEQDYRLATLAKSMALELQAERLAQTREQRLALLIESERWSAPIAEHKNGAPPRPRTLSAAETADLEWRAVRRWNARLADEGKMADAMAGYTKYLSQRPRFHEVHAELAELLLRQAADARDSAARTASLEGAAAQFQHVIELAPAASDRDAAVERLLDLYGPKQLNRPDQQEAVARGMLKRQPDAPAGHYTLATVLFRTGRPADAENVLRGARAAIKPTPAARAAMASELVTAVRRHDDLPPAAARRLFDEADALLTEAEKLNGNEVTVLEGRMGWLHLSADRFERDPARAAAQREQAKRLMTRALAIRTKKLPV